MLEVEKGLVEGPISWDDLPVGAVVSRRFPLLQSWKMRPIEFLSQSQADATVNVYERAMVDGPDIICRLQFT